MPNVTGNKVAPAWQGLPAEAEVKLTSLRVSRYGGLPICVFSYGWASKVHLLFSVAVRQAVHNLCHAQLLQAQLGARTALFP